MVKTDPGIDLYRFDLYSYFYGLVRQIERGKVSTYGALARALGDIAASRACGFMLSINPDPENTPCYRVVKSASNGLKCNVNSSGDQINSSHENKRGILLL